MIKFKRNEPEFFVLIDNKPKGIYIGTNGKRYYYNENTYIEYKN